MKRRSFWYCCIVSAPATLLAIACMGETRSGSDSETHFDCSSDGACRTLGADFRCIAGQCRPSSTGGVAVGGSSTVTGAAGSNQGGGAGGVPASSGAGGSVPGAGGTVPSRAGNDAGFSRGGTSGARIDAGRAGDSAPDGRARVCRFTFDATTVTAYGIYAPRNAGAVWIEDSAGIFVKTLRYWGPPSVNDDTAWVTASQRNTVDAVSGATRGTHGPLPATTWDCTDVDGRRVPDGRYAVCVSFAEDSLSSPFLGDAAAPSLFLCAPFELGSEPFDLKPPGDAHFTNLELSLTLN